MRQRRWKELRIVRQGEGDHISHESRHIWIPVEGHWEGATTSDGWGLVRGNRAVRSMTGTGRVSFHFSCDVEFTVGSCRHRGCPCQ